MNYDKMTRAELIEALTTLQSTAAGQSTSQLQRALHDLQVHQIELEMQNRELRQTQRELEISRNRYADLYDAAPIGYLTLDDKGVIREINLTGAEMLGRGKSQLIGKPLFLYVAKTDRQSFRCHLQQCRKTTEKVTTELRLFGKAGQSLVVELSSVLAQEAERGSSAYRTGIIDITERKQTEESLRQERNRAQQYLDIAEVMFVALNPKGEITLINQKGCDILGYAEGELIGRNWFDTCLPARIRSEVFRVFQQVMAGEIEPVEYAENLILMKQGEQRMLLWHNTALKDEKGKIFGTLSSGEDITERRWAEAQLVQNSKLAALGELAAGVAHEILNPLTGMMNCAQILTAKIEEDSRNRKYAQMIQSEGERIFKIARNMLDFSRQQEEESRANTLSDIVGRSLTLIGWQLDKFNIIRRIEIPEDLPPLQCRSGQLQQVVINLLLNAKDALNARYPEANLDKMVSLTASQVDHQGRPHLRLIIEDHGIGVAPNEIERIFDPFFTTKKEGQGTGMGLAISRRIVSDHSGEITVESEAGAWTRVLVTLPLDSRPNG